MTHEHRWELVKKEPVPKDLVSLTWRCPLCGDEERERRLDHVSVARACGKPHDAATCGTCKRYAELEAKTP